MGRIGGEGEGRRRAGRQEGWGPEGWKSARA